MDKNKDKDKDKDKTLDESKLKDIAFSEDNVEKQAEAPKVKRRRRSKKDDDETKFLKMSLGYAIQSFASVIAILLKDPKWTINDDKEREFLGNAFHDYIEFRFSKIKDFSPEINLFAAITAYIMPRYSADNIDNINATISEIRPKKTVKKK